MIKLQGGRFYDLPFIFNGILIQRLTDIQIDCMIIFKYKTIGEMMA